MLFVQHEKWEEDGVKKRLLTLLIVFFLLLSNNLSAQPKQTQHTFRIMFYNVENFFDTEDDYETDDDEFLPVGFYHWTQAKFEKKRNDIAKVIDTIGYPALVGLCEVENRFVLEQLSQQTPLKDSSYAILHKDSPDVRGIDVALLYRPTHFRLIDSAFFKIDIEKRTREILYAKGILGNTDTLHIFVNHWPSKIGGEKETEPYRMAAANVLRCKIDSIYCINPHANIIAMGDFNDLPTSNPIEQLLAADSLRQYPLYNLAALPAAKNEGTSKYRGQWQLVDMIFCSTGMLDNNSSLFCHPPELTILKADFLLEEDKTYSGSKPKRTLAGPRYIGGTSDHLPIYVDISCKK